MARVLIAWELGDAFGHLARCRQLAEGLCRRGYTVSMALKDVRLPQSKGCLQGFTVLPAPLTPQRRPDPQRRPVNYADVLRHSGFADAQDVSARLLAWQGIFSLARPEVLVADHAPTALLAAQLAGIPHMAIGTGFAIPPDVRPWPSIRPWEAIDDAALVAAEHQLDQVTAAAQKTLGRSALVRVRELFDTNDVLDTFAELDHYGARSDGRYVGPIVSVPNARRVSWQKHGGAKVLAYLRPEVPGFTAILSALACLEAEVLGIAPGLAPGMARRSATRRMRIALAPLDLPPLLAGADLAVGYGNGGFSTQALLAGVPLLMRPRHVEQGLFARRVEAMGAGALLDARAHAQTVTTRIQAMLHSPDHRKAAQAFRDRHLQFSTAQAIERTLALIEQRIVDGRGTLMARHAQPPQEIPPVCLH
ncbi:MAG: UDP-glucuronosyltransferase [Hydrogenophaga sp.]|nr:UDP-glucuronosyltransferase [Hydrogenophaga sp.]